MVHAIPKVEWVTSQDQRPSVMLRLLITNPHSVPSGLQDIMDLHRNDSDGREARINNAADLRE